MTEIRYVEDASVHYDRWKGTAAADGPLDHPSIEEALGLHPDGWWVRGVSIHAEAERVLVYAQCLDRRLLPEGRTIDDLAAEHGGALPVVEIEVPAERLGGHLGAVVGRLFERFAVQLSSTPATGLLRVTGDLHLDDLE